MGGHADDPQTCAGGTLALYADQGHDVVGLSLAGGPPPPPDANPAERRVKSRLDCMRMAQILRIRLDCLNYGGSNSGQSGGPIVYRSASEISGQRYKEFTEILLDKYKPDIVFTHWPIDFHMDHRAASLLTYSAWLASGKRFPLYYMEAELGTQTQNFYPTHYVDITAVEERTHQAWMADTLLYAGVWPLHDYDAANAGGRTRLQGRGGLQPSSAESYRRPRCRDQPFGHFPGVPTQGGSKALKPRTGVVGGVK